MSTPKNSLSNSENHPNSLKFIDLFSGCGGLSLGLLSAGLKGLFAIEQNPDAFSTLSYNLVSNRTFKFDWPKWLPISPMSVNDLLTKYRENLLNLRGTIDVLAGGPPCQGFSFAGRRDAKDERNTLTEQYIEVIKILKPRFLLLENVVGFNIRFVKNIDEADASLSSLPYSKIVTQKLNSLGYEVFSDILSSSIAGVPQHRKRFILIAIHKEVFAGLNLQEKTVFEIIENLKSGFRLQKGLPEIDITSQDAISDLEIIGKELIDCTDTDQSGFQQIEYIRPNFLSPYQRLMQQGLTTQPNSLRLPRHKPQTISRFKTIQATIAPGAQIKKRHRDLLGTKKLSVTLLAANKPAATVTTLPDDILHYSEPRILTVRENARLQSFPDWFEFKGKYTTGGSRRKKDCPRYTQVGNAVPPLFAELLGLLLIEVAGRNNGKRKS